MIEIPSIDVTVGSMCINNQCLNNKAIFLSLTFDTFNGIFIENIFYDFHATRKIAKILLMKKLN